MIHKVSGPEVRLLFLRGKSWSNSKIREKNISCGITDHGKIMIKLNNVRFIPRIFQNIQIRNRQVRNAEFLTTVFASLDRDDCKREKIS